MRCALYPLVFAASLGCTSEKTPVAIPAQASAPDAAPIAVDSGGPSAMAPSTTTPSTTTMSVADARKRLADPEPSVRDAAAATLRSAIAKSPEAAGDPGEASWKKKLAAIKPGITAAEFQRLTGATGEGSVSSGRSTSSVFRLDDYWTVVLYFDLPDKLREVGPLTRSSRPIWVEPPKDFSGKWVTYFVNGVAANDIQYAKGNYERFTAYYDNGQLTYEQRYVDGKIDGAEVGFHRDGKKAYEIQHAKGKSAGRWVHWYANGKIQSQKIYVGGELDGITVNWREDGTKSSRIDYRAGKETGQAAWDEHGKLLYARGSAEQAPDRE